MIISLGFKTKVRPQKCKNAKYAIVNVSKKDLSKIIREFEKFDKLPYETKRPKHGPTDRYFYLTRQIIKCMMRDDALNWHSYGRYTEMTAPSLNFCSTDEENQNTSSCTKLHRIVFPQTRTNKNKALSANLYRRTILRTWTNYVIQINTNQNALLQNKKT